MSSFFFLFLRGGHSVVSDRNLDCYSKRIRIKSGAPYIILAYLLISLYLFTILLNWSTSLQSNEEFWVLLRRLTQICILRVGSSRTTNQPISSHCLPAPWSATGALHRDQCLRVQVQYLFGLIVLDLHQPRRVPLSLPEGWGTREGVCEGLLRRLPAHCLTVAVV